LPKSQPWAAFYGAFAVLWELWYSENMEPTIEFIDSAFRHGYNEESIRHAVRTKIRDSLMVGYINKYALIGFDAAGNLLEIGYNLVDEGIISVFHAMKCRNSFRKQLGL
jgi:hypothetical protein